MADFKLSAILPVFLFGLFFTGCDGSRFFGGTSCTAAGCVDGVTVSISDERPDSLSLSIFLDDESEAFESKKCTNQDRPCEIYAGGETPNTVRVEATWRNGEFINTFNPEYETIQPNGPDCPPTCTQASIQIDLSGE
jgi:hypothetical protein